ncbi:MAG TPA: extracellular solute-binding protein [Hyphomicrobiaceae bacterium]|nr:extracellular solute-binding protein [Hyphomicrobiaceae bacterium]
MASTLPALVVVLAMFAQAGRASAEPVHGLSAFGQLGYPPDFTHFAYADPNAPKGGRISLQGPSGRNTYDSFNDFIYRGVSAEGLGLLFDSLMTRAYDEPDAVYGLLAKSAEIAPDRSSVTFNLRAEARFSDASPVTAADVVFSFRTLKTKGHPSYRSQLRDVSAAEALAPNVVRFTFQGDNKRDLPLYVAQLPILSERYYETHEFDQTTLEPPLGSGPYKVGDFKAGTFVSYRRRQDYWGKDLPVNRGRFNFDEVRYEYFRDRTASLEAIKSGTYDLREEFTARDWVSAYNIPAVQEGRLIKLTLPDERPSGAQGFFLNLRRPKLQDPRVRKALVLAYDFEWANKNLFNGLYTRTESFFENSDMKATGKPSPDELAVLEPLRSQIPPEAFGDAIRPPVSDGSKRDRRLLGQAAKLFAEAGYKLQGKVLVDADGKPFRLEFLTDDPTMDRVVGPYVETLELLGVQPTIRRVDNAQYQERLKTFDFDVIAQRYSLSLTPGAEMRVYWGSDSANTPGSYNLAGISSPAIDTLIEKALGAASRDQLRTDVHALDRVLRAGYYWVPHWYKASHNLVFWDKFSRPAVKPKYSDGIVDTWWYDAAKAAKLKMN